MGREKLGDSQGVEGSKFPRIATDLRLKVKANLKGVISFNAWDSESKENKYYISPLTGIFIGAVNRLECFDQSYGNRGGSWSSTFFVANSNNIVVFNPSGKKEFAGNREALNAWANTKGLEKFKSKKILIVLTDTGKVVEVATNMILFIEQMKQFADKTFSNFLIKLTPDVFDVATNPINISKKGMEYLGPFAQTNKPKYARIEKDAVLDDALWDQYGAEEVADMFIAWKNAVSEGGIDTKNPNPITEQDEVPDNIPADAYVSNNKREEISGIGNDESEDLPF